MVGRNELMDFSFADKFHLFAYIYIEITLYLLFGFLTDVVHDIASKAMMYLKPYHHNRMV